MDLTNACHELMCITDHARMTVAAWRSGDEEALLENLTDLESELNRIANNESN